MAAHIIKTLLSMLWLNTAPISLQVLMCLLQYNFRHSVPLLIGVLK